MLLVTGAIVVELAELAVLPEFAVLPGLAVLPTGVTGSPLLMKFKYTF